MITWLDRRLGRMTMYRSVTLSLVLLAVVGTVLGSVGLLGITPAELTQRTLSPLALPLSAVVLVVWSILANLAFGSLFRVKVETESALITALLLFLILPPAIEPLYLAADAVAALLAVGSKFLIAPRGRHLLNPAALGVFAVYSLGLQHSIWWGGSPLLLPLVVVLGALVLVRTRHASLVLVYLAVSVAGTALKSALSGFPVLDPLFLALIGPNVLLGFFMLTEPLTLPPRRWQRLVVAVVVALVPLLIPLELVGPQLGPITPQLHLGAPEAALLIGNLVAAVLARRRGIRLRYAGRRRLTPTAWELEFTPHTPLRFRPGQYVELSVPHKADSRGRRRTFSIASPPGSETGEPTTLKLGLRIPDDRASTFKQRLQELEEGAVLHATGISGDFLLPADAAKPVLLVAGGIGITPFISQLEHDRLTGTSRDTVLVYSVASTDDIAYAVELGRSGARVLLVAPEPLKRMPENWSWLGEGPLTAEALLDAVPDARARATYLSGPPALIAALRPALRRSGVRRLRIDAFIGY